MTDKIQKELSALSNNEQVVALNLIHKLLSGDTQHLDIKKLKGMDNIFRLKKGKVRILYTIEANTIHLLSIKRRSDNTYNF